MNASELILDSFGPKGFYTTDPTRRAIDEDGACVYRLLEYDVVRHCAVGRYMLPDVVENIDAAFDSKDDSSIATLSECQIDHSSSLDAMLQPKVHGMSIVFWSSMQKLHDIVRFWDDDGLTEDGDKYLEELLAKYT